MSRRYLNRWNDQAQEACSKIAELEAQKAGLAEREIGRIYLPYVVLGERLSV